MYSRLAQKTKRDLQRRIVGLIVGHFTARKLGIENLKKGCDYVYDKRQCGFTVTREMCQMKALAVSKELDITGFKATLHLYQEAPGERVPTVSSRDWRGYGQPCLAPAHRASLYLRETHCSYNVCGDRRVPSSKFIL